MDWVAIGALVTAAAALLKVFWPSSSKVEQVTRSHNIEEVVDDSVLGRFEELFQRIGALEDDLAEAKKDLAEALREIKELRKLEEYLQARLHEKDKELKEANEDRERLRDELHEAQKRIAHLEAVCKRAGINGHDDEEA